ncbi:GNAT family N-acetyltransferase [Ferrimonas lipolytica]|uniref:GNAT family N-acetyltransferase n=1 Tax=Ferrimonas lipolytica TaxID=2724191 RepID=A0A6H1UGA0_9GAMM|nr:GNAT family N-acetyltransferase [Ferrimonas lipolytica]QIZ76822.1 GNAT family N-acetyltransferase [Ferrimonas lipolytica]
MGINKPRIITDNDSTASFSCGVASLDVWLRQQALRSNARGTAKTYVVTDSQTEEVVGYYAIAMGSVSRSSAFSSLKRNSPDPIPMVVLARSAVDARYQGQGVAIGLLKDCMLRSVAAMEVVGGAGILVHAVDDQARNFYTKFGFRESPIDRLVLMIRSCDLVASLKK